jgi:uncharacterized protein (DUF1800 family)
MANYYDVLVNNAFGNYGDLLLEVALHPCMGLYLSDLGNKKADPVHQIYPDENFAREIMQLFTIGLWELNPDGTRKLDAQGQPIPTYDNHDITELARVFTGLAFGGTNVNFGLWPRDFTQPMKMWDAYHDCEAKTLLRGLQLPKRTASSGNQGLAGMADVRAAVANLFNHPNVGPFIGKQLIQRFVTSNPSPDYVARVSAAFADNGHGVRGDMKAVVKAILLDPEARDGAKMSDPHFGKMREPFLRFVNFARAFNAASPSGLYILDQFDLDHMEEPMSAPSVFNFFMPNYRPPGALTDANLLAPEFQIVNASFGDRCVQSLLERNSGRPASLGRRQRELQRETQSRPGNENGRSGQCHFSGRAERATFRSGPADSTARSRAHWRPAFATTISDHPRNARAPAASELAMASRISACRYLSGHRLP